MPSYIHTPEAYAHTSVHPSIHPYTHTYIQHTHKYIRSYMHSYAHTYIHTYSILSTSIHPFIRTTYIHSVTYIRTSPTYVIRPYVQPSSHTYSLHIHTRRITLTHSSIHSSTSVHNDSQPSIHSYIIQHALTFTGLYSSYHTH
jgi:hypothetical protein